MSYKLRINCLKFRFIVLLLLFLQPCFAQKNKKNEKEWGIEKFSQLDAFLNQNQKSLGNDVVTLIWTDTIAFKKEMGELTTKSELPLAGTSQWLTVALVLKLVDEGRLSLDDKVSTYLPIFEKYGKSYVTLRHCLSHFTGIQADPGMLGIFQKKKFTSLQEEVESIAKKEIQTNPGTEFRYSNMGPEIAGRVAEVVMKKTFDQLIKQKLLNPLGMSKTTFSTLDGSAIDPAAGARSTPNDYIKFLAMLLQNGSFNGKQILTEAAVKEMRSIQTSSQNIKLAPKAGNGLNYSLGSWVLETEGQKKEDSNIASALTCPGIIANWPVVDWCRGYAFMVFTKPVREEQKPDLFQQMKLAVDETRNLKCNNGE
jgi:CubicO group peptidase (beta-lactamase class C family)